MAFSLMRHASKEQISGGDRSGRVFREQYAANPWHHDRITAFGEWNNKPSLRSYSPLQHVYQGYRDYQTSQVHHEQASRASPDGEPSLDHKISQSVALLLTDHEVNGVGVGWFSSYVRARIEGKG